MPCSLWYGIGQVCLEEGGRRLLEHEAELPRYVLLRGTVGEAWTCRKVWDVALHVGAISRAGS